MNLRFREHRSFQRAVGVLVSVGAALAAGVWVVGARLAGVAPTLVIAAGVGLALVLLCAPSVETGQRTRTRRGMVPLTVALAGTGWAWLAAARLAEAAAAASTLPGAAVWGTLYGLTACPGLLGAHLERVAADPVARALLAARADLHGKERALAERAAAAHARILGRLADEGSPEGQRLKALSQALVLEMIALAGRARSLGAEVATFDAEIVRGRAQALAVAARQADDAVARGDLERAAREATALGEWLVTLRTAMERTRARLELQATVLEGTALAVATRRASAVAEEADALAPLAGRLREASGDLHAEAQALGELQREAVASAPPR